MKKTPKPKTPEQEAAKNLAKDIKAFLGFEYCFETFALLRLRDKALKALEVSADMTSYKLAHQEVGLEGVVSFLGRP